ncbi:ubiquitin carboxyl-terminal hydrolase 25-like [Prosopis cineraria]|uniref:ubiquitin carboxyl-terminal hydrolase 25-like n=1 Tax=Prosopis cineraria TaxID=364024 RepID=UPI0024105CBF|nr:ubiquitin carboxyl-terminal hydrolase 25-like [Prosopis cineraria]XP_054815331.1 ubiquitin carboxyl-terminal hydrolase 25-like [Prosopis cineraria]
MALQLQMTWLPSLLTQKRKTDHPVGLRNLGNSCYLNSVLQCLTYTPPLANFCLRNQHSSLCDSASEERKRDCPFCLLEKRIVRSLRVDLAQDAPLKIQSCLRIFAEHFRCGRQEDAHEFLRYVIDACHNTCLRLKKLRRKGGDTAVNGNGCNTVVKEIFGGALQSQVKCLSCGYESNKVDEIMDISLDVLHSNSLKDAMQKFFQPEILDGNNKYKCDNCKKLVTAKKQMSILQAPNVLVIQLKRFEGILGGKIDKAVAFEDILVLSSFMCKQSQDPMPDYRLFGTIVHSGYSPESGHYYAYIKDAKGRWYCCDDSSVSLATLKEVLSEKVYILFFSRTNQRPVPVSNGFASNGSRSQDSYHINGSQACECPKYDGPPKVVHTKLSSQQSSWKDMSAMSKTGKEPSSPRVKFNFNGNSTSKRGHESFNGKVDVPLNQPVVTNGHVKDSISLENAKKDPSSIRNGFEKNKVDAVDNLKRKDSVLTSKNTSIHSVEKYPRKSDLMDDTGRSRAISGNYNHKLEANGLNNKPNSLENKRKEPEATSILLAHDDQSEARVQELKDRLGKEAKSVLRSCGWTDKVYDYMSSRKRLRAQEAGNSSIEDEIKKLLISEAKGAFISQIPESLKEDLIVRLRLFSKEKA